MSFETELSDRLHTEVDDTPVDLDLLLAGSVAHGNKLVRRRRLSRIVGGAATIALLGGAFAYAGSLAGPTGSTPAPAGTSASPLPPKGKTADITPQATLAVLLDLLPDPKLATNRRGGFDGTNRVVGVYSLVDYDTAWVNVLVVKGRTAFSCLPKEAGCTTTTLPDGSTLRLLDIKVPGSPGEGEHQQVEAIVNRKDGLTIDLMAVNRVQAKPALTLAQLKTIVLSPRWQPQLDRSFLDQNSHLFVPRPITPPSSSPHSAKTTPTSPGATK